MEKNEHYWNADAIKIDELKWLLTADANAAYAAYKSGEAKVIKDVPTEEVPSLVGQSDFHVEEIIGTYYISMNLNVDFLKDVRVRKALSLAIDREHVANTVMQGTYSAAYNFMGPGWTDANGNEFMNKEYISNDFEANLAEAKALIAEAQADGVEIPVIEYMFNPDGYHQPVGEYLQQAWKELGLTVELKTVDWSQFTPTRRSGDYMIARNGWVGDYTDASNQIELLYSSNGNNDGKYNNPEFDKAMDESRATADGDIRTAALHKAEDIIMEDVACIPLAYYNDFWLQDEGLQGTWHSPRGYWYFMFAEPMAE
jgi:peptide/nickel transport system substrate-binding protein/oligopeptide transport system substrate-binding protein